MDALHWPFFSSFFMGDGHGGISFERDVRFAPSFLPPPSLLDRTRFLDLILSYLIRIGCLGETFVYGSGSGDDFRRICSSADDDDDDDGLFIYLYGYLPWLVQQ